MDYEQMKEAVMKYFGDTSRPASETKAALIELADECLALAEAIDARDE